MTELTIGRLGTVFDVDAHTWDTDGPEVRVQGYIDNTDRDLIALARQQVLGLADSPDEPVVPVTFASDASQDGYYVVTGTAVGMDVSRYAAKSLPWSVNLRRVPNFYHPVVSLRTLGKVRDNVASIVEGGTSPTVALSGGFTAGTFPTTTPTSYTTAFGAVAVSSDSGWSNRTSLYELPVSAYYTGACRVEQKIGSTWYPIVGRQVKAAATDVRVNNGLLRIAGYDDATPASSGLTMESFVTGSTWGTAKTFNLRRSGATLVADGPAAVEVLRNQPSEAIIRLRFPTNTGSTHDMLTVDVRVKRGHRMADVTLTSPTAVSWNIRTTAAMASTTGGYQAASDDANSQRHVITVRSATSLANSDLDVQYTGSSTGPVVFGLGVRETGGATLWGTIGDTVARWFAYLGETHSIQP